LSDSAGNDGIGGDGVDGDQGALEAATCGKPLKQDGDGGGLAALVGDRLLAEHEPAGGGEGGDQMQGARVGLAVMTAPRGLAVDGDEIGTLHDQQRHLGQRMRHPPRLAWVLDRAEMVGQDCQPGLRAEREVRIAQRSEDRGGGDRHGAAANRGSRSESDFAQLGNPR
jgi:hypothetical protein